VLLIHQIWRPPRHGRTDPIGGIPSSGSQLRSLLIPLPDPPLGKRLSLLNFDHFNGSTTSSSALDGEWNCCSVLVLRFSAKHNRCRWCVPSRITRSECVPIYLTCRCSYFCQFFAPDIGVLKSSSVKEIQLLLRALFEPFSFELMHPYDLDGMTDFKARATFSQRVSLESINSELLISI